MMTERRGATAPGDESRIVRVARLTGDGRGVAEIDGNDVLIDGALPGERVEIELLGKRRRWKSARLLAILESSHERVEPPCPYFGRCGGCSLQHVSREGQLELKQSALLDSLQRAGGIRPQKLLEPLVGSQWGYRRRARLGVRVVPSKGGVLVGFRERRKSYVTALDHCQVLDPVAATLLVPLKQLIERLSCPERIPQVELALGDADCALILRHLSDLTDEDRRLLERFARDHVVQLFLQPSDLDSVHPLWPRDPAPLTYRLDSPEVELVFRPTDFVQVNAQMNRALVAAVVRLLEPTREDSVLDLFSGLGNFTLPLARLAGKVTGMEGELELVRRARANAAHNAIDNARFFYRDLHDEPLDENWFSDGYSKVVIDPPRSGAMAAVKALGAAGPRRVVYVSCNPSTLARDSEVLVRVHGYRLSAAGIVDMFPNTAHVESVAVFDRD